MSGDFFEYRFTPLDVLIYLSEFLREFFDCKIDYPLMYSSNLICYWCNFRNLLSGDLFFLYLLWILKYFKVFFIRNFRIFLYSFHYPFGATFSWYLFHWNLELFSKNEIRPCRLVRWLKWSYWSYYLRSHLRCHLRIHLNCHLRFLRDDNILELVHYLSKFKPVKIQKLFFFFYSTISLFRSSYDWTRPTFLTVLIDKCS